MPTLFPPDYPDRPDAPLLSFGPSFSEEIARSLIEAIWHENNEQPHETEIRIAAGLTMLEAFHPNYILDKAEQIGHKGGKEQPPCPSTSPTRSSMTKPSPRMAGTSPLAQRCELPALR